MKRALTLVLLIAFVSLELAAQKSRFDLNPAGIEVHDQYKKATGFFVFTPKSVAEGDTLGLVVFIHGFGGINPVNYGAWLREIIEAGNAVIYPRYQRSMYLTSPQKFAHNAATGIRGGLDLIAAEALAVDTSNITYVGHSYGGTLSAYMMAKEDSLQFPKAFAGLLAAPGTNRFEGSRLSRYSSIKPDAQIVIVTHEGDYTTGTEFAELVHETAVRTPKRIWIRQAEQTIDSFSIGQGHNECYALDMGFDTGYRNYNSKKAIRIGSTDPIDRNLYWPLSLELAASAKTNEIIGLLKEKRTAFEFGLAPNGKRLEALPIQYGEPLVVPAERVEGNR